MYRHDTSTMGQGISNSTRGQAHGQLPRSNAPIQVAMTRGDGADHLGWDNFLEGSRAGSVFYSWGCIDGIWRMTDDVSPIKLGGGVDLSSDSFAFYTLPVDFFRNSHVHYKKLEDMAEAQHLEIFRRVEELMWEDPMSLLPAH